MPEINFYDTETTNLKQEKKMKPTKIKYKKLDGDRIKIVAIENAATPQEIIDEFGIDVWNWYDGLDPGWGEQYYMDTDGDVVVLSNIKTIHSEDIATADELSEMVVIMKKAAKRLIVIRKRVAAEEIREIVI